MRTARLILLGCAAMLFVGCKPGEEGAINGMPEFGVGSAGMTTVTAVVKSPILPLDRLDQFEEPLDDALGDAGLGSVVGSGSKSEGARIAAVDMVAKVNDLPAALPFMQRVLEECGAPRGSTLVWYEGDEKKQLEIGVTDGIAICIDGINLSKAVYQQYGMDDIWTGLEAIMQPDELGEIHGERGFDETFELYVFGKDRPALKAAIADLLGTYPLCENCKVEDL